MPQAVIRRCQDCRVELFKRLRGFCARRRHWIRARWRRWLRLFLEAATVLGALLVFIGAGIFVVDRAKDAWFWRAGEYDKLTSLRAGFNLRYFEDRLGPPFASRFSGHYREDGFRGRDYWVQTVSSHGIVQLYAVTSCDKSFHPAFTLAGTDVEVELNRDHFTDVIPGADVAYDYSIGASAPSLFYEAAYGGTSSFYKTTLWGISSLCKFPQELDVPEVGRGFTSALGRDGREFRRRAVVNTFAETAPATDRTQPSDFGIGFSYHHGEPVVRLRSYGDFPVGPDRVLLQGEDW